jgi:hypothetical protein
MVKKLIVLSTVLLLFLAGCAPGDPCLDLPCGTEGTCREGICDCAAGFEGENCDAREIDKFLGIYYSGKGYCDFTELQLGSHVVSEHPDDHQSILIDDGVLDFPIHALVDEWNFTILPQRNGYTDTLANFHEEFDVSGQGWLDMEKQKLVFQLDNTGCRYELDLN